MDKLLNKYNTLVDIEAHLQLALHTAKTNNFDDWALINELTDILNRVSNRANRLERYDVIAERAKSL